MNRILCIGSVLWDIIGVSPKAMSHGNDVPGRITRQPGGVALNVAMALRRFGLSPALLSSVGQDVEGDDLLRACKGLGLDTAYIYRPDTLRTDIYMAIEDPNGLIAAIADANSLELAGEEILAPLSDGRLGRTKNPFKGVAILDGNLTPALLTEIAQSPLFALADLRVAPASPGKAQRLAPFLTHPRATLYVNLEEANILSGAQHETAETAAKDLCAKGARRVLVTHGAHAVCDAMPGAELTAKPPRLTPRRITGAGDMFMAAHIAAECDGADRHKALAHALSAAASHVAGGKS